MFDDEFNVQKPLREDEALEPRGAEQARATQQTSGKGMASGTAEGAHDAEPNQLGTPESSMAANLWTGSAQESEWIHQWNGRAETHSMFKRSYE